MNHSTVIDSYLSEVSQYLVGTHREKKETLQQVKKMLLEIPDIDSMTLEQLRDVADPSDLINELYLHNEGKEKQIFAFLKSKKRIGIFIAVAVVIIVFLLTFYVVDTALFTHGHQVNSPVSAGEYIPDGSNGRIY